MKSRMVMSAGRLFFGTVLLAAMWRANVCAGAGISLMTPGPIRVNRGDRVSLEVQPTNASSRVEWWSGGKIVCEKLRCDIDTADFTPGEYLYDVAVIDGEGVATASIGVSADISPPLYQPRKSAPLPEELKSGVTVVKNGEWILVARAGGITFPDVLKKGHVKRVVSVARATEGISYTVSGGAQGILRHVGFAEEWLISSGSTFQLRGSVVDFKSGQAIWRKLHSEKSDESAAFVAGAKVDVSGSAFIGVETGQVGNGALRARVTNYEGGLVSLTCAGSPMVPLSRATARVLELNDKDQCVAVDKSEYASGDPSPLIAVWSPWWGVQAKPSSADRWRIEWPLFEGNLSDAALVSAAEAGLREHYCADTLDLLGVRQTIFNSNEAFQRLFGECQFALGMYQKSLKRFEAIDAAWPGSSWTAFMLGRSHQMLRNHQEALRWFDQAERRGFKDKAALGRWAAKSAAAEDESKLRLRWLETIDLNEPSSSGAAIQNPVDRLAAIMWRLYRPRGGVVRGQMYMDSQALPVNSKKVTEMPAGALTSRSVVFALDGQWWTTRAIARDARLKLRGSHDVSKPQVASISMASRSIHDVSLGMLVGDYTTVGEQPADRWVVDVSAKLGTGLSGGERQRDRLGWEVLIARPKWQFLTLAVRSDKYLDPKPGGADVIDLDLNRYTGEADHSHLDLVFAMSIAGTTGRVSWMAGIDFGAIDYRTGLIDKFDHTLTRGNGEIVWEYSPVVDVAIEPGYVSRAFKDDGGSDVTTSARLSLRFHTAPLWRATIHAGLENRSVSEDEEATWSRQVYGVALSSDL